MQVIYLIGFKAYAIKSIQIVICLISVMMKTYSLVKLRNYKVIYVWILHTFKKNKKNMKQFWFYYYFFSRKGAKNLITWFFLYFNPHFWIALKITISNNWQPYFSTNQRVGNPAVQYTCTSSIFQIVEDGAGDENLSRGSHQGKK